MTANDTVRDTKPGYTPMSRKQRFRHKYLTFTFLKKFIWKIVRFALLLELVYVIIFPFLVKIMSSFMSGADIVDRTVRYLPKSPTWDNFLTVINKTDYFTSLLHTFLMSLMCGVLSVIVASMVGYGLAKFRFRGRGILFGFVILGFLIPPQTILLPLFMRFRYFDVLGLAQLITGNPINLLDSPWPLALLTITGFGFRTGLYIFLMRQFYKGLPDELSEAAYVDGCGTIRTFLQIILPLSATMLTTVFLFSFAWQWTDTFYSGIFFNGYEVLSNTIFKVTFMPELNVMYGTRLSSILLNTATLLALLPLVIFYLFAQKKLVQGVERSGLVG